MQWKRVFFPFFFSWWKCQKISCSHSILSYVSKELPVPTIFYIMASQQVKLMQEQTGNKAGGKKKSERSWWNKRNSCLVGEKMRRMMRKVPGNNTEQKLIPHATGRNRMTQWKGRTPEYADTKRREASSCLCHHICSCILTLQQSVKGSWSSQKLLGLSLQVSTSYAPSGVVNFHLLPSQSAAPAPMPGIPWVNLLMSWEVKECLIFYVPHLISFT